MMDQLRELAASLSPLEVPCPEVRGTTERAARSNAEWAPVYWQLVEIQNAWDTADPLEALSCFRKAGRLGEALLDLPAGKRQNAVTTKSHFRQRGVALWLLHREAAVRRLVLDRAMELADAAVMVSRAIAVGAGAHVATEEGSLHSSGERELLSRCLARCANARRMARDYAEANALMIQADRYLGPHPPESILAEYEFFRASLLAEQGEHCAARIAMNNAARLYVEPLNDEHLAGAVDVLLGSMLRHMGDLTEALAVTRRAAGRIDSFRDPELADGAKLNLCIILLDMGEVIEAKRIWYALRPFRAPIQDLQRLSTGGIIDLHEGRLERAEDSFKAVSLRAAELGDDYLATHIILYLALTQLRGNKRWDCIESLKKVMAVYQARAWNPQDVVTAMQMLQCALAEESSGVRALEVAIKKFPSAYLRNNIAPPLRLTIGRGPP